MTRTLRRERIQKFEAVIQASDIYHYALSHLENLGQGQFAEQMVKDLSNALADAAASRTETQQEPEESKPDMVDFELSKLPAMSLRKAVGEYFKLNVNWETKTARQWLEWAHGENITAEQIEQAAETWRNDKQFNWTHPTLKGIFEKWKLLMDVGQVNFISQQTQKVYTPEEEPQYVPAPQRKP